MKISIKSVWRSMRRQSVLSVITVVGTALAVFLIMVVVMVSNIRTFPFAPESARGRILKCGRIQMMDGEYTYMGGMSYSTFRDLYESMTIPEEVCTYGILTMTKPVTAKGAIPADADVKFTDDRFWRVFDFTFVDGRPYDKGEFDAGLDRAVISRSTARSLFGTEEASGRTVYIDDKEYTVTGVVDDVSPLATMAYGEIWLPVTSERENAPMWNGREVMGILGGAVLARSSADFDSICEEYYAGVARVNENIKDFGWRLDSIPPFTVAMTSASGEPMSAEEKTAADRRQLMVYLILLIVPAINLSAMTESRLSERTAEFGVRRAFGCTRREILTQVVVENFFVTLVAGAIGVALSLLFAVISGRMLFNTPVSLTMLLNWSVAAWAVVMCFVLNLMSAGVPAWNASRRSIVAAIAGQRK